MQCSIFAHGATSSERSPRLSCAGGVSRNIFGGKKGVGVPDSHSSIDSFFFNNNISFLISEKVQGVGISNFLVAPSINIYLCVPTWPMIHWPAWWWGFLWRSIYRAKTLIPVTIASWPLMQLHLVELLVPIMWKAPCVSVRIFLDIEIEVFFFLNLTMVSSGVTRF